MARDAQTTSAKPLLRGYFHQEAFFVALGASVLLIAKSSTPLSLLASTIYAFGLLVLFGISALYHRRQWGHRGRTIMKRLDHSAIFVLIAGTFTPICLLALPALDGRLLLAVAWSAALCGILQSILWVGAPKWFTALLCVGVGWLVIPYLGQLSESLGAQNLFMLATGGVFYTLGAVFYAIKWPRLASAVFGYHELFHLLTIFGAALHFFVVYQLIQ
jgi:hemolysin III